MPADILVAERTSEAPLRVPNPEGSAPQTASALKELVAAKRMANDLAYRAYDQLDGEGMHSLSMIEGLIAGAITKIEAAGVRS